jgi:hypothetical protein
MPREPEVASNVKIPPVKSPGALPQLDAIEVDVDGGGGLIGGSKVIDETSMGHVGMCCTGSTSDSDDAICCLQCHGLIILDSMDG